MIGEVTFDAGGSRYILFLGTAAQCRLEEMHDKGFFAIVEEALPNVTPAMLGNQTLMAEVARGVRISKLRDLAWAALLKHQPSMTLRDVEDLADLIGPQRFGELLGKTIAAGQGQAEQEEAGHDAAQGKPGRKKTGGQKRAGQS
jgi:hypothetical protein